MPTGSSPNSGLGPIKKSNKIFITPPKFFQILEYELTPTIPDDPNQPALFIIEPVLTYVSFPLYVPVIQDTETEEFIEPVLFVRWNGYPSVEIGVDRNSVDASKTYKIYYPAIVPKSIEYLADVFYNDEYVEDITPDHPSFRLNTRILQIDEDIAPETFEIVVAYDNGRREIFTINKNALVEYNPNSTPTGRTVQVVE